MGRLVASILRRSLCCCRVKSITNYLNPPPRQKTSIYNFVWHFRLWRKLSVELVTLNDKCFWIILYLFRQVIYSFGYVTKPVGTQEHLKRNTGLSFVRLIFSKCQSYQWTEQKTKKLHPICMRRLCCRYQYAGLQNVDECYCGNSYGKHGNYLNVNTSCIPATFVINAEDSIKVFL